MKGVQPDYLPDLLRGNTEALLLSLVDELGYAYGYHLNRQQRRYYRITDKGKEVLRKKIAMWQNFTAAMSLIFGTASSS